MSDGTRGVLVQRPSQPSDVQRGVFGVEPALARPITAWVLGFGSLVLGAIIAVWPVEIRDATRRAIFGPRSHLEIWTFLFWIASALWAYVLYERLSIEHESDNERLAELLRAIHHVPNYRVVKDFPDTYGEIADEIDRSARSGGTGVERLRAIEKSLQEILKTIAQMTAEFARAGEPTSYGANLMLVETPTTSGAPFPTELMDCLLFYDKEGGNPHALKAILYLPEALLLSHLDHRPPREVPHIALPVPHADVNELGHRLALPGGPSALLTGEGKVVEDTSRVAHDCADFSKPIIAEIEKYFAINGRGSNIRSFASFRIGTTKEPIGILNIDSNQTYVLGPEREYYYTFYALISPILRLLRRPLVEYAQLAKARGEYIKIVVDAPAVSPPPEAAATTTKPEAPESEHDAARPAAGSASGSLGPVA